MCAVHNRQTVAAGPVSNGGTETRPKRNHPTIGGPGVRIQDNRHWLGAQVQEKSWSGPGSESTHSGHNAQKICDPPRPPPPPPTHTPKKWHPATGGWRGQKNHWGVILSAEVMILQRVRHPNHPPLKTPKRGVYGARAYAWSNNLPSPLFKVIFAKGKLRHLP